MIGAPFSPWVMDHDAELHRVIELSKTGDLEAALITVRRILKHDPANQRALVYRYTLEARLLEKSGDAEQLIDRYRKVLELHPGNREAKRKLERQLSKRGSSGATSAGAGAWPPGIPASEHGHAAGAESEGGVREPGPEEPLSERQPRKDGPSEAPAARTESRRAAGVERRVSPRIALDVHVGLHSDSNFYTGFSDDISEGGLFIATYHLLEIGTRLRISFGLPGGFEIETEAEVCWLRDPLHVDLDTIPGMGVRFIALEAAQRKAIHDFMGARAPLFFDHE